MRQDISRLGIEDIAIGVITVVNGRAKINPKEIDQFKQVFQGHEYPFLHFVFEITKNLVNRGKNIGGIVIAIEKLLAAGCDVNIETAKGSFAASVIRCYLNTAPTESELHKFCKKWIIKYRFHNNKTFSPVEMAEHAIKYKDIAMLELLLKHKLIEVNWLLQQGFLPVEEAKLAIKSKDSAMLEFLLKHKLIEMDWLLQQGFSPVEEAKRAIVLQDIAMLDFLLKYQLVKVNEELKPNGLEKDKDNFLMLHYAISLGSLKSAEYLISRGAKTYIADQNGKTIKKIIKETNLTQNQKEELYKCIHFHSPSKNSATLVLEIGISSLILGAVYTIVDYSNAMKQINNKALEIAITSISAGIMAGLFILLGQIISAKIEHRELTADIAVNSAIFALTTGISFASIELIKEAIKNTIKEYSIIIDISGMVFAAILGWSTILLKDIIVSNRE